MSAKLADLCINHGRDVQDIDRLLFQSADTGVQLVECNIDGLDDVSGARATTVELFIETSMPACDLDVNIWTFGVNVAMKPAVECTSRQLTDGLLSSEGDDAMMIDQRCADAATQDGGATCSAAGGKACHHGNGGAGGTKRAKKCCWQLLSPRPLVNEGVIVADFGKGVKVVVPVDLSADKERSKDVLARCRAQGIPI
jgi:hypothetical protein